MGTVVFIRERRSHGKRYIKAAISEISQRNISLPLLFVQKQQSCGVSQKEIAAILKMTPENVRVLSYRAKRELRTYMEDHNYDLS